MKNIFNFYDNWFFANYIEGMSDYSHYPRFKQYLNKAILGIDFGAKVIGTAVFRPGKDPFPLKAEKIIVKSEEQCLADLQKIISNESIDIVVFGVPYLLDGSSSENTRRIQQFGQILKSRIDPVLFFEQDETLTTKTAEEMMKNSPQYNFRIDPTQIDCLCATIIIEDFLRS